MFTGLVAEGGGAGAGVGLEECAVEVEAVELAPDLEEETGAELGLTLEDEAAVVLTEELSAGVLEAPVAEVLAPCTRAEEYF